MDPLSLLREFNINKQVDAIKIEGDDVNFGGRYVFKKSAYTAFKGQRDYYTIEAVYYVLQTRGLSQPEYLKAAAAAKLGTVAFVDRRKLLDFLDGKTELQLDASQAVPPVAEAADADAQPAAKRARIDDSAAASVSSIFDRYEMQLRDRNSMLVAPNKDFKRVLDIASKACFQLSALIKQKDAQAAKAKEVAAKQKEHAEKKEHAPRPAVVAAKPSGRFERDTTTDALKAMGGAGAAALASAINMYGAAGADAPQPPASDKPAPAPAPPPSQPKPSAPQPHHKPHHGRDAHKPSSSQRPPSQPSSQPGKPGSGTPGKDAKPKGGVPIIIVPSGMTAMITMYNARTFLEEGRFEPSAVVQARGVQKETSATITRTIGKPPGSKGVPYQITDKAPPAGSPDWARVVAVIVQGAKWQFKDWPHTGASSGNLVEAFNKVMGVFVHYADEKVPATVADWNVRRLGLAREKRHMDSTALLDFYRMLDQFLMTTKSTLTY